MRLYYRDNLNKLIVTFFIIDFNLLIAKLNNKLTKAIT